MEFPLDDVLGISSGETYYIVLECDDAYYPNFWVEWCFDKNKYLKGESFIYTNHEWCKQNIDLSQDFCFVTYASINSQEFETNFNCQSQSSGDPGSQQSIPPK